MIDMDSGIGIAVVVVIVGSAWKISAALAVIKATMADKTDVALLQAQSDSMGKDLSRLWSSFRSFTEGGS